MCCEEESEGEGEGKGKGVPQVARDVPRHLWKNQSSTHIRMHQVYFTRNNISRQTRLTKAR